MDNRTYMEAMREARYEGPNARLALHLLQASDGGDRQGLFREYMGAAPQVWLFRNLLRDSRAVVKDYDVSWEVYMNRNPGGPMPPGFPDVGRVRWAGIFLLGTTGVQFEVVSGVCCGHHTELGPTAPILDVKADQATLRTVCVWDKDSYGLVLPATTQVHGEVAGCRIPPMTINDLMGRT